MRFKRTATLRGDVMTILAYVAMFVLGVIPVVALFYLRQKR